MNRILRLTMGLVIVWTILVSPELTGAVDEIVETSDEDVAEMVERVTSGSAIERRDATEKLLQLGERAVAPLAVAAETEVIEDSQACFDVLARLRASDDVKTADAAKVSLERLSASDVAHVARRANTVLRLGNLLRQRSAGTKAPPLPGINANGGNNVGIQIAGNANGQRQIQVNNGDEKIPITDANGKDIRLKHTRIVDGKSKTDEYKGADLEDLKKNHPDAAKLYEKTIAGKMIVIGGGNGVQIQIGGGAGNPVPLQAAPIPGFRVPVRLPFNVQADGIEEEPSEPRTIRAEQGGRKIEINDIKGKAIRMTITETIEGKEVSKEFSADDLKTLHGKHPEIAKLYEKYAGRTTE